MKFSLVIPMYNESAIVAQTIKTVYNSLSAQFAEGEFEVLMVDDGSIDDTVTIANEVTSSLSEVCVLGYPQNAGKGAAVKHGMLAAVGEIVLFSDCDLAYGHEIFAAFTDKLTFSDADIVIGSRKLDEKGYEDYTFLRKVMSHTFLRLIRRYTGLKYSDSQCGIKCFRRETAQRIFAHVETNGWAFDLEALLLAQKMRLNVAELPARIINHRESRVRPVRDAINMLKSARIIKKRVRNFSENT